MRKVIVAINISLDGFCNHTPGIVDEELHTYFNKVMASVDTTIMGRKTYQLMEAHWPNVAKNKSGSKAENEFAEHLERIEKIVASTTLDRVDWGDTRIIESNIGEEVRRLKAISGNNILIGGPSLISYLTKENLIDEFHFVIQPFVLTQGIKLFTHPIDHVELELVETTQFDSGVIANHYRVK